MFLKEFTNLIKMFLSCIEIFKFNSEYLLCICNFKYSKCQHTCYFRKKYLSCKRLKSSDSRHFFKKTTHTNLVILL